MRIPISNFIPMDFIEELSWRGMIHDIMPGTREQLKGELTTAYLGIDPTADSLHIGHLVGVMMLKHLQQAGHKPIALVGGATGMIGDPSMKSSERVLLDEQTLTHNQNCIQRQLARFLDFESNAANRAEMVNNHDWMKKFSFLDFIRDIGKHITVNYMLSKDSVKRRVQGEEKEGLSFTEFTYQLVQGYDFLHLYREKNCKLQMGGSDQWGNITTGTELIRRVAGGEAFALTCPLITKADGGKFGKTESGNVWLDPTRTSPYQFYQFWLNTSDDDAVKYIKIFTLLSRAEVENLIDTHANAPHERILQKRLAKEITTMVHGLGEFQLAEGAARILFDKNVAMNLRDMDEKTFLTALEGVPVFSVPLEILKEGVTLVDFLSVSSGIFPSKGEARRALAGGGVSINKEKAANPDARVDATLLINHKYILVQKGKKNYSLVKVI